jgi:hypothetical protein
MRRQVQSHLKSEKKEALLLVASTLKVDGKVGNLLLDSKEPLTLGLVETKTVALAVANSAVENELLLGVELDVVGGGVLLSIQNSLVNVHTGNGLETPVLKMLANTHARLYSRSASSRPQRMRRGFPCRC